MALKTQPSPLTQTFSLAWRWDPALDTDREDFEQAFKSARETCDFSGLIKPGEQPTMFVMRAIPGSVVRELMSLDLEVLQSLALAFRIGLVRIDNLDIPSAPKVERAIDHRYPQLGKMVTSDLADFLDALAAAYRPGFGGILNDIGNEVMRRSLSLSPLS